MGWQMMITTRIRALFCVGALGLSVALLGCSSTRSKAPGLVVTLDLGADVSSDAVAKLVSSIEPTAENEWIGAQRNG